ncbi:hypothetical protein KKD71_03605 [Patescibacteria group bacterium]|nr:hypothetical protein [Patescibacteria group bacterium]
MAQYAPEIMDLLGKLLNLFNNTLRVRRPVSDDPKNKKTVPISLDQLHPIQLRLERNRRGGLLARFKKQVNDGGHEYPGQFTAVPALVSASFEQFVGQDIWYAVAFPGLSEADVLKRFAGQVPIWPLLAADTNKLRYRRYIEVSFEERTAIDKRTEQERTEWVGFYHGKAVVWKPKGSPYEGTKGEPGVKLAVIIDEIPRKIFAKRLATVAEIRLGPWDAHDSASTAESLLESEKVAKEICGPDEVELSKGGKLNAFALFDLGEDALSEQVYEREASLRLRSKSDYRPDADRLTKLMRDASWTGEFLETYRERARLITAAGKKLRQLTIRGDEVRLSDSVKILAAKIFGDLRPERMHAAEMNAIAASTEFGKKSANALKTMEQIAADSVIEVMVKSGWRPTSAEPKELRKIRKTVIEAARKACLRQVLADDEIYHRLVGSDGGGPLKALAVLGFDPDAELTDELVVKTAEQMLEIKPEDVTEDHPTVKEFRRVGQTDRDFTNQDRGFKDIRLAVINAAKHLMSDAELWEKHFSDS